MGPIVSAKTDPPETSDVLADVALIDAEKCASIGSMSISWWHEKVAAGQAPQPAIRQPRCTRWRAVDVARFWREFAERGASDVVMLRAKKASEKAQASRRLRAAACAQAGA